MKLVNLSIFTPRPASSSAPHRWRTVACSWFIPRCKALDAAAGAITDQSGTPLCLTSRHAWCQRLCLRTVAVLCKIFIVLANVDTPMSIQPYATQQSQDLLYAALLNRLHAAHCPLLDDQKPLLARQTPMADAKALAIWNQADPTSQRQAVATLAKDLGRPFLDMSSQTPSTIPVAGALAWLSESASNLGNRARAQPLVDTMASLRDVGYLVFSFDMDAHATQQDLQIADMVVTMGRRAVNFPRRNCYATLSSTASDDPRILEAIRAIPQTVANYMESSVPYMARTAIAFREVLSKHTEQFDPKSARANHKKIARASEEMINHRTRENVIPSIRVAPALVMDMIAVIFDKETRARALSAGKPPSMLDFFIDNAAAPPGSTPGPTPSHQAPRLSGP